MVPGMWVFGDADGLIILGADGLDAVFTGVAAAAQQEEALAAEVTSGTALADAFGLDLFLAKRAEDPRADLNAHLAEINRAI